MPVKNWNATGSLFNFVNENFSFSAISLVSCRSSLVWKSTFSRSPTLSRSLTISCAWSTSAGMGSNSGSTTGKSGSGSSNTPAAPPLVSCSCPSPPLSSSTKGSSAAIEVFVDRFCVTKPPSKMVGTSSAHFFDPLSKWTLHTRQFCVSGMFVRGILLIQTLRRSPRFSEGSRKNETAWQAWDLFSQPFLSRSEPHKRRFPYTTRPATVSSFVNRPHLQRSRLFGQPGTTQLSWSGIW